MEKSVKYVYLMHKVYLKSAECCRFSPKFDSQKFFYIPKASSFLIFFKKMYVQIHQEISH